MKKRLTMFMAALFLMVGTALAQTKVNGTVTSQDDGQPVIGATVLVVGTQVGTVTDANGRFSLTCPVGKNTLRITYVGMEPLEVSARPNMRILLTSDQKAIDEVVVLGYGSAKKLGSIVGAVKKVGNATLEKSPTANFTDALAGQVSGLSVLSSSGDPTASATIRLRGVNSINSSNTPLFILDGAPISSTLFNTLNPADIANITVLKDAASTAIYGSRAANGVIVITSKKGKLNEKVNLSLRAQYGISTPVEDGLDMMNSQQYVEFRDKIGQPVSDAIRDLVNKYGISTNWRDELLDKSAPTYTLEATVSGGGDNTTYYISANHHKQDGIIDQSGMQREAIRANIDTRIAPWLKVGLQSNLGVNSYESNRNISDESIYLTNPMVFARMALPYDSPNYYEIDNEGNIIWGDRAQRLYYSSINMPWFDNSKGDTNRKTVTVNLNAYEQFTPLAGLTIRLQQAMDGYDYTLSHVRYPYASFKTPMGQTVPQGSGISQDTFTRYYSFTSTNTLE